MRELEMLREQARVLRDLAARSTNSYGMKDKFLALAQQCEEFAEGRQKALGTSYTEIKQKSKIGH